jgi:hypothetical protein
MSPVAGRDTHSHERGNAMTRDDFTAALEEQLRLRGLGFSRAAVLDFVASVWPLAEDDPDPVLWAERFAEAGLAEAKA